MPLAPKQPRYFLASLDCRSEYIHIFAVIISELEFGDIERHIFPAHFVECADYATLEYRPEAFNGLCMNSTYYILFLGMVDDGMRIIIEVPVTNPLISAKQTDFMRDRLSNKGLQRSSLNICNNTSNDISLTTDRAGDWRVNGCLVQIILGVVFWTGNLLNLIPLHMVLGLVLVLALWTLAVLAVPSLMDCDRP